MITSMANRKVKYIATLQKKARTRREEDLFVAEGLRMCREILPEEIHELFLSESFAATKEGAAQARRAHNVEIVSDAVFAAMADTQTPQDILALVRQRHYTVDEVTAAADGRPALLMVLEHLQDPGNLGTILRAGEGAGVTGILMDGGTADIYSPKVIRSTMGSVLRMPFTYVDDLPAQLDLLKRRGIRLYAAHLAAKHDYDEENYTGSAAFLIGNEAAGLSAETAGKADALVRIPMQGKVESLNAAVAASVLMFEAARQRRAAERGDC